MERLRHIREQAGYSQQDLADKSGVSQHTISEIELGRRKPQGRTLRKLANALGVEVADFFPLEQAPERLEVPFMARPEVREWLQTQGHMTTDEFLSWAEDLELMIDEDEFPHVIEDAIKDLQGARDHLLEALKTASVRNTLFPAQLQGLATKDERLREALRPARDAGKLGTEIRREYAARELALVNYSKDLFVLGKTAGYLSYGSPAGDYAHKRHQQMLEARRVLEESYAKAAAI